MLIGADGYEEAKEDPYAHLRARAQARAEGEPEPTFLDAPLDENAMALASVLASGSSFG